MGTANTKMMALFTHHQRDYYSAKTKLKLSDGFLASTSNLFKSKSGPFNYGENTNREEPNNTTSNGDLELRRTTWNDDTLHPDLPSQKNT